MFKLHTTKLPIRFGLLILGGMYLLYQHYVQQDTFFDPLGWIAIGTHEVGHLIFGIFGNELLGVAGGTIMQLVVAVLFLIEFIRQKHYLLVALAIGYLGSNFYHISLYIHDATRLQLPLMSFSSNIENTIHDRNYLLDHFGVLIYTDTIALFVYYIALLCYYVCFMYGGRVLVNTYLTKSTKSPKEQ